MMGLVEGYQPTSIFTSLKEYDHDKQSRTAFARDRR